MFIIKNLYSAQLFTVPIYTAFEFSRLSSLLLKEKNQIGSNSYDVSHWYLNAAEALGVRITNTGSLHLNGSAASLLRELNNLGLVMTTKWNDKSLVKTSSYCFYEAFLESQVFFLATMGR